MTLSHIRSHPKISEKYDKVQKNVYGLHKFNELQKKSQNFVEQ